MLSRYFHTIRFLKGSQTFGRVFFNVCKLFLKEEKKNNFKIREFNKKIFFFPKKISYLGNNNFIFLNKKKYIESYRVSDYSREELLWKYNLHYFDYLNQKILDKNENYESLINKWIQENKFKENLSWDSYPLSLRIVNWVKWLISNQINNNKINEVLFEQGKYLSKRIEYHLGGNHLISNAKAMIFFGIYFKCITGRKILKKGKNLLEKELDKQILADGAHYEKSSMYQSIIIEDLLDIYSISLAFPNLINSGILKKIIPKMITFQLNMTHSNGGFSYFNDCSSSSSLKIDQLMNYSKKLGFKDFNYTEGIKFHKNSNFVSCKNSSSNFIFTFGSIGPNELMAHSHANSLSFELSLDNQKVFINSGVSSYQNQKRRDIERATSSHNTLELNEKNSSDVWASFRCGKRANSKLIKNSSTKDELCVYAKHDGYSTIFKKRIHFRKITYNKSSLIIEDSLEGSFNKAIVRVHLHPEVDVINDCLFLKSGQKIKIKKRNCNLKIKENIWAKGFGDLRENKSLEFELNSNFSCIKFSW